MDNPQKTIRMLIADDHKMVREGLRAFLEYAPDIEVIGEAESADEAVAAALAARPDAVLMDLVMGGGDGIDAILRLRAELPDTRLIALSSFTEPQRLLRLLRAGAHGFLQKTIQPDELLNAIRQVMAGNVVLDPVALAAVRQEGAEAPEPAEPLTPRELDVLRCLCRGMSNKQIGVELRIAEPTVKVHISHILAKFGVYDRSGAIIAAARLGLVNL